MNHLLTNGIADDDDTGTAEILPFDGFRHFAERCSDDVLVRPGGIIHDQHRRYRYWTSDNLLPFPARSFSIWAL